MRICALRRMRVSILVLMEVELRLGGPVCQDTDFFPVSILVLMEVELRRRSFKRVYAVGNVSILVLMEVELRRQP